MSQNEDIANETTGRDMALKRPSLHLRLTPEQTLRLLEWARQSTQAEVDADCEPSGYALVVSVGGPYGCEVEARRGDGWLPLGEASLEIDDGD